MQVSSLCNCPGQCKEIRYNFRVTTTKWPTQQFSPQLLGRLCWKRKALEILIWLKTYFRYNVTYNNTILTVDDVTAMLEGANCNRDLLLKVASLTKFIEASYMKVHVYFNSNSAEIIKESPRYEWRIGI